MGAAAIRSDLSSNVGSQLIRTFTLHSISLKVTDKTYIFVLESLRVKRERNAASPELEYSTTVIDIQVECYAERGGRLLLSAGSHRNDR